jgi:FAD/FMN-containing dehydrogenase
MLLRIAVRPIGDDRHVASRSPVRHDRVTGDHEGDASMAHGAMLADISASAFARLRERFGGPLIRPGDADYDDARAIWNGAIDRRPGLIARCSGPRDVAEAVRFAAEHDLVLSVRSGGHGVGGLALCEGIVVDLSGMKSIDVDAAAGTARLQAGVTLGELDAATQPLGLAVPIGIATTTGVAGLTLGGGIGWLMRRHGLTVDNLVDADVVLADGTSVTASEGSHPDLFWALRGGGGNFGVVTSFRFRAHPVGPTVLGGPVLFPLERAEEVTAFHRQWATTAPRELSAFLNYRKAPPAPWVPGHLHSVPVVAVVVCWIGDLEAGARVLEPLRALGPMLDACAPRPFVEHQSLFDATVPPGWHYYWKSVELDGISPDVVESVVDHVDRITSPRSYTLVFPLGGAVADVDEAATAYPRRNAGFDVNINGVWLPEEVAHAPEHTEWVRSLFDRLEPSARGVYVNFLGEEGEDRVRAAYGASKYETLARIKARYDPENLFRRNQNIRPAT